MVKIQRTYTIDEKNIKELENVSNASKLVNDLLTEHFFGVVSNKKEEISAKLKQLIRQKEELETLMIRSVQQFDAIEAQEKEQARFFKGVPKEILEDFNRFPDMNEDVLKNRWKELYKGVIKWEELKDLYARFVSVKTTK